MFRKKLSLNIIFYRKSEPAFFIIIFVLKILYCCVIACNNNLYVISRGCSRRRRPIVCPLYNNNISRVRCTTARVVSKISTIMRLLLKKNFGDTPTFITIPRELIDQCRVRNIRNIIIHMFNNLILLYIPIVVVTGLVD